VRPKDSHAIQGGPSRIVVADDHPLFRSAITCTLGAHPDLEVVAEAANGQEALELCRCLEPELVLMDLRMPHMDGVAATRAIKRELPKTPVLILTAIDESRGLSDSLEAAASGYTLKDAPVAQIIHAVRRVLSGGSALDDELAIRLVMSLLDSQSHEEQENHKGGPADPSDPERDLEGRGGSHHAPSLTSREVEILRLVVRGQTNQQIGRTLSISASTVKRHVRHISQKLGVRERVQAAVRAVELGVLDEREGD
jgi:DNA-binding NarL/FixJ family response regulator